jgi:uncharacterized protein YbaR (Trm112 family)
MRTSDLKLVSCPGCAGDLDLVSVDVEGEEIINVFVASCLCSNLYPILNSVYLFLSNQEMDALLSCEEKMLLERLRMADAGMAQNTIDIKHVWAAANWEYQFADAFSPDKMITDSSNGFWGENAFYKFSGLDKDSVAGKVVGVFCGRSDREAWHLCRADAGRVVVPDLGGHINRLPDRECPKNCVNAPV